MEFKSQCEKIILGSKHAHILEYGKLSPEKFEFFCQCLLENENIQNISSSTIIDFFNYYRLAFKYQSNKMYENIDKINKTGEYSQHK